MKNRNLYFSSLIALIAFSAQELPADPATPFSAEGAVVMQNRVLAKVLGKPISVMDVVKKMDLLFYRQYSQYASSAAARYQFYQSNWETILASLIDDKLIMADAEEKKVTVTDGDVREEMERLFGPDVVVNVDRLGLTYEEAWQMLETELVVRDMLQMMVRNKARAEVHPKAIKERYEKTIKDKPLQDTWVYHTLTLRSSVEEVGKSAVNEFCDSLAGKTLSLEEVASLATKAGLEVKVSEEYQRKDHDLSSVHKEALEKLMVGSFSAPLQIKKSDDSTVRMFFLKEKQNGKYPSLHEMEEKFSMELFQKAYSYHHKSYIKKLREHYGITSVYLDKMTPKDFQPFALR